MIIWGLYCFLFFSQMVATPAHTDLANVFGAAAIRVLGVPCLACCLPVANLLKSLEGVGKSLYQAQTPHFRKDSPLL